MKDTSITQLLKEWQRGEKSALDELLDKAYKSLSKIGRNMIRNENRFQTLQTQDLIHEAYMRFLQIKELDWRDREHFFSVWSGIMRRVLIDRARAGTSKKRAGALCAMTFDDSIPEQTLDIDVYELFDALDKLESVDIVLRKIVEMRYFMGLSTVEIAIALEMSEASIKRKWSLAQAWLYRHLQEDVTV